MTPLDALRRQAMEWCIYSDERGFVSSYLSIFADLIEDIEKSLPPSLNPSHCNDYVFLSRKIAERVRELTQEIELGKFPKLAAERMDENGT